MFHTCMKFIVSPLEDAGRNGIYLVSSDGGIRRCFPVLAMYIGDYPEQVLVTLVKTGECPVCPAPQEGIGSLDSIQELREIEPILEALEKSDEGAQEFVSACEDVGIKPVQMPFWTNLPFLNIYSSITPDILHQLYQGVVKHVLSWIQTACGTAEIDARCRRMPISHNVRLFMKGISHLSRVTGTEHDQICRIMLSLVSDIQLPSRFSNTRLIKAVCALLDFVYLAKYPIHTSETLENLDDALYLIELFGTTNNYNTEYTEHLHIDLAKNAYHATNFRDEVSQMTIWLDRKERMLQHEKHVRFLELKNTITPPSLASAVTPTTTNPLPHSLHPLPCLVYQRIPQLPKHPTILSVPIHEVCLKYGATFFETALSRFVTQYQNPDFT
ncbi:hypothetical protein AN958_07112 [Leucoagaricus sp. SymC.cos]|nr:hypothetical protein AN958_07112 [Leucoagaricus sp. SymC.cos]